MLKVKKKFLIALPTTKRSTGFNHPTILVSAINELDAIDIVKHLKPLANIGDIKEVNY